MPLLNISVNGNSARRASVFFKPNGVVLTDMWGGSGVWWQLTDATWLKKIETLRANKAQADVLTDSLWAQLAQEQPAAVATQVQQYGQRSNGTPMFRRDGTGAPRGAVADEKPKKVNIRELVERWFKFFSEFHFKPQPRFMNSVGNLGNAAAISEYVVGYFALTNNSFADDVREKVKSREFSELVADTLIEKPSHVINKRLEITYGEPGGGKTTLAIVNHPDAKVVMCHPQMTPDELFRGFDFDNGKPVFKSCALREAMEQGKVVILDEINLLTQECLRALQAITDCKPQVTIGNDTITIKDGFRIIGTMNLNVGDMVCPLPDPLVDRAASIKHFEMEAEQVAKFAW